MERNFMEFPFFVKCKLGFSLFISFFSFLIPNKYFLIKYAGGKIYLNLKESNMMINRALNVHGYWEVQLFKKIIKPNMTILDIGANKGYFSLLFAKLMNDTGRVVAIEPVNENCYWINKSIKSNKYKCISVEQVALSNKEGKAEFFLGKKSGWGSLFYNSEGASLNKKPITIKTRKLDNILNEKGIDKTDIIKIDIEGAELLALKGAESILKNNKDIKLILNIDVREERERNQLFNLLDSLGFKIYRIGKKLKKIDKIDDNCKDIYAIKTDLL
jgi:FkbM family methyltransferase